MDIAPACVRVTLHPGKTDTEPNSALQPWTLGIQPVPIASSGISSGAGWKLHSELSVGSAHSSTSPSPGAVAVVAETWLPWGSHEAMLVAQSLYTCGPNEYSSPACHPA